MFLAPFRQVSHRGRLKLHLPKGLAIRVLRPESMGACLGGFGSADGLGAEDRLQNHGIRSYSPAEEKARGISGLVFRMIRHGIARLGRIGGGGGLVGPACG